MHRSAWKWAGLLAVALGSGTASAQTPVTPAPPFAIGSAKGAAPGCGSPPPCCPTPAAPWALPPSSTPSASPSASPTPTPETPAPSAQSPTGTEAFRSLGLTNLVQANLASAGSGTSATSAAASTGVGGITTPSSFSTLTPTILPGLLTAASVQSPRPMDRVFFAYSYLDRFQTVGGGTIIPPATPGTPVTVGPTTRQPGFNLNMYYVGAEKTFFDGMASAYILAPFLQATNNITGQPIDGVGNVSFGLKGVLLSDAQSGSVLSGGFTVSVPTGHNTTYVTERLVTFITAPATFTVTPFTSTTNPTYLQPWLAGVIAGDRFFVQEYFGVIIPTDSVVSTFINNDIAVGFRLYRSPGSFLSAVTPVVDLQALLPINHIGSATGSAASVGTVSANGGAAVVPPTPIPSSNNLTFSDQLFLTSGVQFGLGERALLSAGIITPLAGPKAFNWGVTVGLNF